MVAKHDIAVVLYDVAVAVGDITAERLASEAKAVIFVNIARFGPLPDLVEQSDLALAGDVEVSLVDRLREVEARGIIDREKLNHAMHEAHRAAYKTMDLKVHDQMAYRVAAYAALTLNYYASDIVLGGGPESEYLSSHEVYSHFTFVEKCAFDIALRVITTERAVTIPLEAQAGVVTDFARCLRESSEGRVFYPEGVGVTELGDILHQLAEPQDENTASGVGVHDSSDGTREPSGKAVSPSGDDDRPPTPVPRARRGRRIAGAVSAGLVLVVAGGWGGAWWGRHDTHPPPLVDAGPARSGVPLGTNVSIRMLATYQDFDGQPRTVEAVSGVAPDRSAILTLPADAGVAILRLELHLGLTETTDPPDADLQIAFGDDPLKPVGETFLIDPEHPNGHRVRPLTINPGDTRLTLARVGETVYQFDATLGDPSNYWCGYNTKPMVVYATNGTNPMVVASLPIVVFKDCSSTPR